MAPNSIPGFKDGSYSNYVGHRIVVEPTPFQPFTPPEPDPLHVQGRKPGQFDRTNAPFPQLRAPRNRIGWPR